MNSSKKENLSPLAQLKEKWRALDKNERDYWRKQFVSSRKISSLREEIAFKLKVSFISNIDLFRFSDWIADEDKREAAKTRSDEARVRALYSSYRIGGPSSAALRQLYRNCLRELERSAFRALLGPGRAQSLRKYAHKNVEAFYLDVLCLCVFALMEETSPRNGLN
jgi:hypothetical protein